MYPLYGRPIILLRAVHVYIFFTLEESIPKLPLHFTVNTSLNILCNQLVGLNTGPCGKIAVLFSNVPGAISNLF